MAEVSLWNSLLEYLKAIENYQLVCDVFWLIILDKATVKNGHVLKYPMKIIGHPSVLYIYRTS